MNRKFITAPRLTFDAVLNCPDLIVRRPLRNIYDERHRLLGYSDYSNVWLVEKDNLATFEFGGNEIPEVLSLISHYFQVEIVEL